MRWLAVVRFSEVALKGRNKPAMVRRLARNVQQTLTGAAKAYPHHDRIYIPLPDADAWPLVAQRLRYVPGVRNYSLTLHTEPDLDAILAAFRHVTPGDGWSTFRIVAQRADKSFPLTSPEIERQLGAAVKAETGAQVRLSREADLTLYVEIRPEGTYCYTQRLDGPGGLPVGVSGRVVALISGGIDSPVASFMMMRRGCRVTFVHCHAYPYLDSSTIDKTKALVQHLTRYQNFSRLHLVPLGDIQRQVVVAAPEPLRVVIYRRFMVRIAQELARREGALALATGESLGQVASQTLRNLAAIEAAATLPILRPLIGVNKEEIVREAQSLGTYETSIEPDQDCCQLFVPRHPATGASLEEVLAAEAALDVPALVQHGLSQAEVLTYRWPQEGSHAAAP
ncbi:MAG: tRNA uracil 4-sulfurtransferase ThiI [Dehalococcoidia bacterium]